MAVDSLKLPLAKKYRPSALGRKGEFGVFVSSHTAGFLVNGRSTAHSRPDLLRAPPAVQADKRTLSTYLTTDTYEPIPDYQSALHSDLPADGAGRGAGFA